MSYDGKEIWIIKRIDKLTITLFGMRFKIDKENLDY